MHVLCAVGSAIAATVIIVTIFLVVRLLFIVTRKMKCT